MEIVLENNDLRQALGHALHLIAPLARDLYRGLNGLRAGVHRQHFGGVRQRAQFLAERPELIIAEGARGQRQPRSLLNHRVSDLRMTVALVDG